MWCEQGWKSVCHMISMLLWRSSNREIEQTVQLLKEMVFFTNHSVYATCLLQFLKCIGRDCEQCSNWPCLPQGLSIWLSWRFRSAESDVKERSLRHISGTMTQAQTRQLSRLPRLFISPCPLCVLSVSVTANGCLLLIHWWNAPWRVPLPVNAIGNSRVHGETRRHRMPPQETKSERPAAGYPCSFQLSDTGKCIFAATSHTSCMYTTRKATRECYWYYRWTGKKKVAITACRVSVCISARRCTQGKKE